MAQRVMSAANDAQVLFSVEFVRQHIGEDKTITIEHETQRFTLATPPRGSGIREARSSH